MRRVVLADWAKEWLATTVHLRPSTRANYESVLRVHVLPAFGETPIDDGRGSVLAAGRYSYTGPLASIVVPDYTVDYWDYQARASHRVFAHDTLTLFAFGSYDELTYKKAPTFRVQYHRADLRLDHPLPDGHLRVALTAGTDDTLTALQTPTGAGASASFRGPSARLRAELQERLDPTALLRAGADAAVRRFDDDAAPDAIYPPHTDLEGGVYADLVWRPSRLVEIVPGAGFDLYRTRDRTEAAPQPRLAAKIRATRWLSWITSMGVAHQEPTEEVFVPAKLPTLSGASVDGYQLSEALEARIATSMRVRMTAFASRLVARNVSAEARTEGLELFAQRDFTERLGGFLAYTLARTDATAGTVTARASWDRRSLVSAVLGYDLGRGWRAGARFFFESGRPYVATCPDPTCAPLPPGAAPDRVYAATGTLPPFYRLDARLEKRWEFAGGAWLSFTAEGFNVLDKSEPTGATFVAPVGLVTTNRSPIILPSVGLEGGF